MKLSTLCGRSCEPDPDILGLTSDSRKVARGYLFAALSGSNHRGAEFIRDAEKNGAAAILCEPGAESNLPKIVAENPRQKLAFLAAKYYREQPSVICGITGTNGKTSVAHFAAQLWESLGCAAGSIGTLGARALNYFTDVKLTTPEPVTLHRVLAEMSAKGVTHAAIEISSHALAQYRADAVRFSVAAFTNITRDHLDYHADFEEYFEAKQRLFTDLLPESGVSVINADGEGADALRKLQKASNIRLLTTGSHGRDIRLLNVNPHVHGVDIVVQSGGDHFQCHLPLFGAFQAENACLAAGIVIASGYAHNDVIPKLNELKGVNGRMDLASQYNGSNIFVDYAHTPDAIKTAIAAARPHTIGRIIAIIGAGGERDKEKRPLMGAAAASVADQVIVTDDNPRKEDPAAIRAGVLSGANDAIEIADRAAAIRAGIEMLQPGDTLLIAGKGHETYQLIGDRKTEFNDKAVAIGVVTELSARSG